MSQISDAKWGGAIIGCFIGMLLGFLCCVWLMTSAHFQEHLKLIGYVEGQRQALQGHMYVRKIDSVFYVASDSLPPMQITQ